jgi:hypothetical protein
MFLHTLIFMHNYTKHFYILSSIFILFSHPIRLLGCFQQNAVTDVKTCGSHARMWNEEAARVRWGATVSCVVLFPDEHGVYGRRSENHCNIFSLCVHELLESALR